MYNDKVFFVAGLTGGYAEPMSWLEADELATEESKGSLRLILDSENNNKVVAIYHDGLMYIAAQGNRCEFCSQPISVESFHYCYSLTGHAFCSQSCGVKLGVLAELKSP